MKKLLAPLLVLTLAFEVAGASGGNFFCRVLGQRLTTCCCPDAEERSSDPVFTAAACCDLLENAAPMRAERLPSRLVANAPERSAMAMDVELPEASIVLGPDAPETQRGSGSGPPRRIPVFLSLRQLLI
jgi:hypothetical protein